MDLNELVGGSNPWHSQQKEAQRIAARWEKSGLLKNLSGTKANNMAVLLENQSKQLLAESSLTGGGVEGGSFAAGVGEQWAGVALPLVRKVFGMISSKDFVSVQPMNLPAGLVFYLDFKYGTDQPGNPAYQNQSVYGDTSASGNPVNGIGGLYGGGRFAYSTNETASATLVSASAVSATEFTVEAANTTTDINFDSEFSASVTGADLYKITVSTASLDSEFDSEGIRAFELVPSSSAVAETYFPLFTKYDAGANVVTFIVSASGAATVTSASVEYQLAPKDNARGDFEDGNTTLNGNNDPIAIPEFNVEMRSEPIVAKTKKLKAQWTPEFSQDLNAFHSLDAEAELTSMMSEYVSMEIDLEILDMLIVNAPSVDYWSARSNYIWNGSAFEAQAAGSGGFYNTQGGWFQTLGTKVQKISNIIHKRTLRGGANFLVCSPTVATVLESIPGYAANTDGSSMGKGFAFGVQKVGALNSRFTVYKNPYMTENTILMGYRGSQFLETGAVYAPYIPLIMTPLVYDPNTFTPRKGLMTRYAKKMVRPEFYGKIYVHGLETI